MDTSGLQKPIDRLRNPHSSWVVPAGLAGCAIILSYELFGNFMKAASPAVTPPLAGAAGRHPGTQNKPLELADLTGRNLFRPIISAPPPPKPVPVALPAPPPPPPKIPISQKASHLRLVGIVNGDPVQAIIEDARSHKTLYVTAGQTLDEVQVDKILSDRVVLSSADERMELML